MESSWKQEIEGMFDKRLFPQVSSRYSAGHIGHDTLLTQFAKTSVVSHVLHIFAQHRSLFSDDEWLRQTDRILAQSDLYVCKGMEYGCLKGDKVESVIRSALEEFQQLFQKRTQWSAEAKAQVQKEEWLHQELLQQMETHDCVAKHKHVAKKQWMQVFDTLTKHNPIFQNSKHFFTQEAWLRMLHARAHYVPLFVGSQLSHTDLRLSALALSVFYEALLRTRVEDLSKFAKAREHALETICQELGINQTTAHQMDVLVEQWKPVSVLEYHFSLHWARVLLFTMEFILNSVELTMAQKEELCKHLLTMEDFSKMRTRQLSVLPYASLQPSANAHFPRVQSLQPLRRPPLKLNCVTSSSSCQKILKRAMEALEETQELKVEEEIEPDEHLIVVNGTCVWSKWDPPAVDNLMPVAHSRHRKLLPYRDYSLTLSALQSVEAQLSLDMEVGGHISIRWNGETFFLNSTGAAVAVTLASHPDYEIAYHTHIWLSDGRLFSPPSSEDIIQFTYQSLLQFLNPAMRAQVEVVFGQQCIYVHYATKRLEFLFGERFRKDVEAGKQDETREYIRNLVEKEFSKLSDGLLCNQFERAFQTLQTWQQVVYECCGVRMDIFAWNEVLKSACLPIRLQARDK